LEGGQLLNPEFSLLYEMSTSSLSEKAHNLVKRGKSTEDIEKQINTVVKRLWNLE
jgi:hypothetical protein